jgi:UDP-N-acetylmuramate dehydrogenase
MLQEARAPKDRMTVVDRSSRENIPLAAHTTLRLGGQARRFATADREEDVIALVRECDASKEPLLILGGGSNLVVADEGFAGTVLHLATRGRHITTEGERVVVTAGAGEVWDDLVAAAVDEGLVGVECLAGIPGLVGAVPMQNVGAYGQDVSETIVRLRAWDRRLGRVVEIGRDACRFAYRSSVFRGSDRHVILDVTFALERSTESRPVRYAELAKALSVAEGERASLATVRSTVVELRRKKGMVLDPSDPDTQSAGSFFTNPILDAGGLATLRTRVDVAKHGSLPTFPESDGRTKVSAAWLIERAGFVKGYPNVPGSRVSVSTKHALALTNRGGATTSELIGLAREIRDGVRARFGVTLENEPVFVGLTL